MIFFPTTKPGARLVRLVLPAVLALAVFVTPAMAQLAAQGATTVLRSGSVRGVDASFDPNTNTYMVVGAQDAVFAVCTNAAGAAISGEIIIKPASGSKPFGSFPRVQYSADLNGGAGAFLVIWQQEEVTGPPQLHTRIVSCTAGPLGAEQVISPGVVPWTDFGASGLAYSATSRQFLVAWKAYVVTDTGTGWRMVARLVDLSGAGVGSIVTLSTEFARDPDVAWNPILNEFGVSFSSEASTYSYSVFVRVPPANIAAFSRTSFNIVPGCMTTVTDLDYNRDIRRYVMTWYETCGTAVRVAEFDEAGTLAATSLVSSTYGSYDALSLAYNPISKTFALATIYREGDFLMAAELDSRGARIGEFFRVEPAVPYAMTGHQRIASNTNEKTWLTTFRANGFTNTAAQVLVTATSGGGGTCSYALSPTSSSVAVGGGSGSFTVTTTSDCSWTATTATSWIHVTGGASGTGSGTVSYSVDANAGPARSGTIIAGGQTFTVSQASNCSYVLSPASSGAISSDGAARSFTVTTNSACPWTASTAASWIHITSGSSGTGSGTVAYSVDANMGGARAATIIVSGQTYTVTQDALVLPPGCTTVTVLANPPRTVGGVETLWQSSGVFLTAGRPVTILGLGTWTDAGVALTAAGHPSVTVTGTNCPLSGAPLLALIGRVGTTGTPFLIGTRTTITPPASGVLYLAPQDNWYTTEDNAGSLSVPVCVDPAGSCTFSLNPSSSGTIAAGGGSGSFTVSTETGCSWSAATTASWIHVTSGTGTSSGTVTYTVDLNTGAARTGTITVGGQTYTVTQAEVGATSCTAATVVSNPTPPPGVGGVETMWQPTAVTLTAGQPVVITASGTWSDAGVVLTAAGHPSVTVTGTNCPLSGAPLLALIGRIGPTGAPFLIGASKTFTPPTSGVLYLAPQDNWYTLWDNAGSLSVSVCQAAGGCTYALSPTSSGTIAAAGGSGSFTVTTGSTCTWTPATSSSWIHITSGSGPASGTVAYTVDVNPGSARTGTITVADKIYTVSQAANSAATCTIASVVASPTPPPGVGGVETMWQATGVTLTAGQPVVIAASGTWTDAGVTLTAAGHPTVTVTGTNCPLSGAPLLALIGRIGPTGAPFLIGASKSFTPATSGVLYLAPQDNWYTLWDNAGSLSVSVCLGAGGSCSYSLSPTSSGTIPVGGGSGSFTVTTETGCAWSAAASASWIHVTSGSGPSSGTVNYVVDVNPGSARTGSITVGDKTFAISQAGVAAVCTPASVVASPTAPPGVGGVEPMWQSTGVTLTAGQPVIITTSGTWSDAGVVLTAAGHPSVTVTGTNCPLSGAPLLALIGRIGSTGTPFLIGASLSFTPATSGVLYLAPQDNWYTLWDNAGSLSVNVCLSTGGGCSYSLSPTSSGTIASAGGSGSFTVTTGTGCAWTAATTASWIHITSGSGSASGTVGYTVDSNPGPARSGTITVADKIYTVSQAGSTAGCTTVSVIASPVAPPGVGGVEPMWQPTAVTLTAGQPVVITASGTWTDAGVVLTAAGHPTVTVAGTNCPLTGGAPLLALIGRIGPTGTPFLIGASKTFTPPTSGVLYLAPQDNWYTLWDNAGSLSVAVCR
jgi:hypothetical protein